MLGLICVQTVCKGYQQTTKIATSMERVKELKLEKQNRSEIKKIQSVRKICNTDQIIQIDQFSDDFFQLSFTNMIAKEFALSISSLRDYSEHVCKPGH